MGLDKMGGGGLLTGMGGPGDQPGMARKAAAGPIDAGSDAVATTSTTISSSSSYSDSDHASLSSPPPEHRSRSCSAAASLVQEKNR